MAKEISCGFIILNKNDQSQMLACQAYGKKFKFGNCDVPKGHVEEGENHLQTAIRELKEETGFEITNEHIYDCGVFQYLSYKDLHLYLIVADLDITKLHCDSQFEHNGKMVPEVFKYHWITDPRMYYRSLQPIVLECLDHYREGML